MHWTYGLNKIYTQDEIEAQKASPSWEREYCLKYAGSLGNVFPIPWIDKAVELGELYKSLPVNQYVIHSIGCDPGFGSSKTAIVVTEHLKEQSKIRILETYEFERPDPARIAEFLFSIHRKYWNSIFYVDAAIQLRSSYCTGVDWTPLSGWLRYLYPVASAGLPTSWTSRR